MKKLVFLSLLLGLILSACRDDVNDIQVIEEVQPPVLEEYEPDVLNITGSVEGQVIDENTLPIAGAIVQMGNEVTTTNDYGHFFFKDVQMNKKGTLVKIQKSGYFQGSRRFFPLEGEEARIKIEMIPANFDASFQATAGGTVNVNGDARVEFPANSIQMADGTAYLGMVEVAAYWLDPTALRTFSQMPGNLQGVNAFSTEVALATFGMMAVELQSPAGEKLNIAEGKTATLRMPIPTSVSGNAPEEIDLWSYSETYGVWALEGTAIREGNQYIGEVAHFSFWNCDAPFPVIELEFTVQDPDGNPLVNHPVQISVPGLGVARTGYTGANGGLGGKVPKGEVLEIEILEYDFCSSVMYSGTFGPFDQNTDLGVITVNIPAANNTQFTGSIVDCDGNPVQDGLIIVSFDNNEVYEYITGGSFDFFVTTCQNTTEATIKAIDLTALLESDPITSDVEGTFDLGQISICDNVVLNYLEVMFEGETAIYPTVQASVFLDSIIGGMGYATQVNLNDGNATAYIYILKDEEGTYTDQDAFWVEIVSDTEKEWQIFPSQGEPISLTITNFGDPGEYITGELSFTGSNTWTTPAVEGLVTCKFSLLRD